MSEEEADSTEPAEAEQTGIEGALDQCRRNLIPATEALIRGACNGGKGLGAVLTEFNLAWEYAPVQCEERAAALKIMDAEVANVFATRLSKSGSTKQAWARKKILTVLADARKKGGDMLSKDVAAFLEKAQAVGVKKGA